MIELEPLLGTKNQKFIRRKPKNENFKLKFKICANLAGNF